MTPEMWRQFSWVMLIVGALLGCAFGFSAAEARGAAWGAFLGAGVFYLLSLALGAAWGRAPRRIAVLLAVVGFAVCGAGLRYFM